MHDDISGVNTPSVSVSPVDTPNARPVPVGAVLPDGASGTLTPDEVETIRLALRSGKLGDYAREVDYWRSVVGSGSSGSPAADRARLRVVGGAA